MVEQERRGTRYQLNLEMIGLRLGDKLSLIDGNHPDETCIIVDLYSRDFRVVHRNTVKSLTAACNDVYGVEYNDPGSAWAYEGETLSARRRRFEEYHQGY